MKRELSFCSDHLSDLITYFLQKTSTKETSHFRFVEDSKLVVDSLLSTTENNNRVRVYRNRMMVNIVIAKEISSINHINHFAPPTINTSQGYPTRKHDKMNLDYMDAYFKNE